MVQELYKVIDASELLTVKSELVALEVEVLQGLVLTQSLSELSGTLWPEEVALKLKLPQSLVGVQHLSEDHS